MIFSSYVALLRKHQPPPPPTKQQQQQQEPPLALPLGLFPPFSSRTHNWFVR